MVADVLVLKDGPTLFEIYSISRKTADVLRK